MSKKLSEELKGHKEVIEKNLTSIGLVDMWVAKAESLEKERDEIHEDRQRMAEELIDATPDPQDGEWQEIVLLRQQLQKLKEENKKLKEILADIKFYIKP